MLAHDLYLQKGEWQKDSRVQEFREIMTHDRSTAHDHKGTTNLQPINTHAHTYTLFGFMSLSAIIT